MTLFDIIYIAFGILDLCIVLLGPIIDFIPIKRKVISCISLITIILFFRNVLPAFSPYLELLLVFFVIFFITNRSLISVCISLFNYLLSMVISYVFLFLLDSIWGISEIETVSEYCIPYNIFLMVLFILSTYLIRLLYNHFVGKHVQLPTSLSIFMLIYLAVCALLFIYNYTYEESLGFSQDVVKVNTILFLVFFSISGAFIVVLMLILKRDAKLQAQNVQYESLQKYTEEVEGLYQNIRGFKHDYINILTTMQLYMENEDWDALKEYYAAEIFPTSLSFQDNSQVLGQLSQLQIPEIKSILYNKCVKALELGICVDLEIISPVEEISAKYIDIARVIGIYLDNAIEALQEMDKDTAQRNLRIAIIKNTDAVIFVVQNDCKDFQLNIRRLGALSYSTKGKNRGMGLHLANRTLRSYRNILRETNYSNHVFTQSLTIYNE